MKKTIIGTVALTIVVALFTMNQPKVEVAIGADLIEKLVEKPLVEAVDDSWTNIVASVIDTGEGTTDVVKEVVVASTTKSVVSFTYKGETLNADTDFVGYNNCLNGMWGTSTVAFCTEFHKNQINKNAQWAKESKDGRDKESIIGKEALTTKDL